LQSLFFQSLVAQPLRTTSCVVETCLEFEPRTPAEMAGLVCYYDTRTHYYLRVTRDEVAGKVLGIVLSDDGVYREPAMADGAAGTPADSQPPMQISVNDWPRFHLRASIRDAALQFSASPDGKAWRDIGPVLDASKLSDDYGTALHFTGAMVGLCAQDLAGTGATADFDYFEIEARGAPS
jgi:xylan 1,4-beta-xylosidase